MPSPEQNHEKQYTYEPSLNSLQAELAKSKGNYKHLIDKLELLIEESNKLNLQNQGMPKPPSITFKKFKTQQSN